MSWNILVFFRMSIGIMMFQLYTANLHLAMRSTTCAWTIHMKIDFSNVYILRNLKLQPFFTLFYFCCCCHRCCCCYFCCCCHRCCCCYFCCCCQDLGQKDFGHVTCPTCGMVYTRAQPDDEAAHIRHHKSFVNGLKFTVSYIQL